MHLSKKHDGTKANRKKVETEDGEMDGRTGGRVDDQVSHFVKPLLSVCEIKNQ